MQIFKYSICQLFKSIKMSSFSLPSNMNIIKLISRYSSFQIHREMVCAWVYLKMNKELMAWESVRVRQLLINAYSNPAIVQQSFFQTLFSRQQLLFWHSQLCIWRILNNWHKAGKFLYLTLVEFLKLVTNFNTRLK